MPQLIIRSVLRTGSLLAALLLICPAAPGSNAQRPPNIVLILVDDLGWADLGCYGSRFHETPHLDRLASQGVRFMQAYAASPLCSPTRASILTGKHPARLHLTTYLPGRPDNPGQKLLRPRIHQQLPLEEVTLAEALKGAGYRTAHIGKWHLGGKGFLPEDQGFDVNLGGTAGGSPPGPGGFFGFLTPTLKATDKDEYLTDRLTVDAERFIEDSRDQPFFLYLCHFAVHIPLQGKADLVKKYQAKATAGQGLGRGQNNTVYAAMLESVDQSIGRVVKKLEDTGLADNTLVIFTSDNGGLAVKEGPNTPATSNAPLRGAKGQLFEGGIRVPLIAYWPGRIPGGRVSEVPVSSLDDFPTFLNLAGVKPPEGGAADGGVDLMPLFTGGPPPKRDTLFWHFPHYSNQGGTPSGAVRKGDFKLIEFFEDDRVELYNLAEDAGENRDLSREMPDRRNELHRLLKEWRESVDAQMPTPNPDYDPDWKAPALKLPSVPTTPAAAPEPSSNTSRRRREPLPALP
jgi:arylsulfatase A-like enzyme